MANCKNCVHQRICDLWSQQESQDASCFDPDCFEPKQEPVRHGHWVWLTEDKYRCSYCYGQTRVDEVMGQPIYTHCPYCGTKMDEEPSE